MIPFPPVVGGEALRISASTFAVFEQCPASASARLQGRYGPDSRPGFTGGLAHRIFARHLSEGPIGTEDLERVCREEIGGSTLNHKLASLGLKPSGLARVVEDVGELYERFRTMPLEGFAGAEVVLEVEPADDINLVGSVDAVFRDGESPRLVDWKTGELGDLTEAQLRFYALLWALERSELPSRVEAISVRTGERHGESPTLETVTETAGRVADMVATLREAWASEQDSLERCAGPWCRFCPILDECSEGRSTVALLDRQDSVAKRTSMFTVTPS